MFFVPKKSFVSLWWELLSRFGHFDTALESYDQTLALDPDSVDVNWNKSLLLLLQVTMKRVGRCMSGA